MKKRILACLLALVMLIGAMPVMALAAETVPTDFDWKVSKSKTATDLDADGSTRVTLSLPSAEETLASLNKQRTILNVRKKKRRALYDALSDAEALAPARDCYESGMPGMEEPFARYMDAVSALEQCGIHREQLMAEKAELYRQLADVNREIRRARKEISMCDTIERNRPQMEHDIHVAEAKAKEVERDEYRRR